MRPLCNLLAIIELAKRKRVGARKRRQPILLFQPWSLILGAFLIFFAFPPLAQACQNFRLEILGPDMARPGDNIVYTIKYQNLGWPLLKDVTLVGQIPEYTSLVSAPPNCQLHENTLVCLVGRLEEGEGGQGQLTLQVDESAPAGATIQGKVLAVGREPGRKSMLLGRAQVTTKIVVPKLAIAKTPSTDIVYAGEAVTYTYTVTNIGNVSLKDVTLVDDQKSPSLVCDPVTKLEPDAAFSCTWTTTLETDTTNIATVTGLDPWGPSISHRQRLCQRHSAAGPGWSWYHYP